MNNVYSDPELKDWFHKEYLKTGEKLDMGKSCVRFKKIENLPLEIIGETVSKTPPSEFIKMYKDARKTPKRKKL